LPTTEERLEAVERIEQVAQELRTVIKNTKPIDYAKAYGLAKEKAWSIRNTWNNFDRFGLRQFETKSNPVAGTFRREKIELARAWFHWCPTVTQDLTTSDNWQSMKLTTAEEVFQRRWSISNRHGTPSDHSRRKNHFQALRSRRAMMCAT
jgi:hypothetical protein